MDHIWLPHHQFIDGKLYNVICKNCCQVGIKQVHNWWPARRSQSSPDRVYGIGSAGEMTDCAAAIIRHVMET